LPDLGKWVDMSQRVTETNSENIPSATEGTATGCMYVSYFHPFYVVKDPHYFPVQAGKAAGLYDLNSVGDNTGTNISDQNFIYSELTVLYWVWKNRPKTDYVGFCHYRRFFDFAHGEKYPLAYRRYSPNEASLIEKLPSFDYDTLLSDCDLIVPINFVMPTSLRRNYEKNHYPDHYNALRQAVIELFPDYRPSFDSVLEGTNKLPPYNMLVTRWELFDRFCHFIFTIFFKLRSEIRMPDNKEQQRIFGYMSERLLAVFIRHHHLKVKEYPLFLFSETARTKSKFVFHAGSWIKTANFKLKYSMSRLFGEWGNRSNMMPRRNTHQLV
jgi:hypothetical protein